MNVLWRRLVCPSAGALTQTLAGSLSVVLSTDGCASSLYEFDISASFLSVAERLYPPFSQKHPTVRSDTLTESDRPGVDGSSPPPPSTCTVL